jgi:hypothetical protein
MVSPAYGNTRLLSAVLFPIVGEESFNAEAFVADLSRGDYDGRLHEEFRKLTHEQLQEVAALLTKQLKKPADNTSQRGSEP